MQLNFFAIEDKLNVLSSLGDNLERLKVIDWEIFRPELNSALKKTPKGPGGRPPYDYVMMLKICILQRLYNLSDEQTEYQINDRLSFQRFLGLTLADDVPDENTIWNYKNALSEANLGEKLFNAFLQTLESENIITHEGTIVDATFVDAPRGRNTREENEQIREGKTPEEWEKPENKNKLAQKDVDARWAKKGNETHYGYKNHTKIDADSKMITDFKITSANVHDSKVFLEFIDETDKKIYADSAYCSEEIANALPEWVQNNIHEKGYRNAPLTEEQKQNNKKKSKIRARGEHPYGFMTNSMKGITLRSKGIKRAIFNGAITNMVYDMFRYAHLKKACL